MFPSLSGHDVLLAEWLWDCIGHPTPHIVAALASYAHDRGWTAHKLVRWDAEEVAD